MRACASVRSAAKGSQAAAPSDSDWRPREQDSDPDCNFVHPLQERVCGARVSSPASALSKRGRRQCWESAVQKTKPTDSSKVRTSCCTSYGRYVVSFNKSGSKAPSRRCPKFAIDVLATDASTRILWFAATLQRSAWCFERASELLTAHY